MKIVSWVFFIVILFCRVGDVYAQMSKDLTEVQRKFAAKAFPQGLSKSVQVENFIRSQQGLPGQLTPSQKQEMQKRLEFDLLRPSPVLENGTGRGGGASLQCLDPSSRTNLTEGRSDSYHDLDAIFSEAETLDGSFAELSEKIFRHLEETLPQLAYSYARFFLSFARHETLENSSFDDVLRVWKPQSPLPRLHDEDLTSLGPKDSIQAKFRSLCRQGSSPRLVQAVVRSGVLQKDRIQVIQYLYAPEILKFYLDAKPLHLSSLIVHEWLRDFIPSAKILRKVNAYFHSKEFLTHSTEQIRRHLIDLGYPADHFLASRSEIETHVLQVLQETTTASSANVYSLKDRFRSETKKEFYAQKLSARCGIESMSSLRSFSFNCAWQIKRALNDTGACRFAILKNVPMKEMFEIGEDAQSENAEEVLAERTSPNLFDVTMIFCPDLFTDSQK